MGVEPILIKSLSIQNTFTALKYPNYRLWFGGQIVSLFGTWMQSTAQGFLVYELTGSSAALGYVGFAAGIPSWLFMLWGGVIADRIPRRRLLVITQSCMMLLAFALAGLTFLGIVQPWHVVLLAFMLGIANAFDAPARLALAPELVEREDLTNAIALNGTMFNAALIIGPTVGSLIYAAFGPAWCFVINGLSFIAVIIALLKMNLPSQEKRDGTVRTSALREISEGLRYVAADSTIRTLILLVSAFSLFGFSYMVVLPAWSVEILGGDVTTNGLLQSARGVGALIGALTIASLGRFNYRGKLLTGGIFMFPILMMVFSLIRELWAALIALAGVGAALVMVMNIANSLVQTSSTDSLRGRVNGIYSLTFFGFIPIGSFLMGLTAEQIGETRALQVGAVALLLTAILIWFAMPNLRKLE